MGFDLEKANKTVGHGLANMQTRVANVGGDLDIITAPGEGTTILAWVPRASAQGSGLSNNLSSCEASFSCVSHHPCWSLVPKRII